MTRLDALCHASYQGKWYNGFVSEGFSDQAGRSKLGTEAVKQRIVTSEEPVAVSWGTRLRISRGGAAPERLRMGTCRSITDTTSSR
jgi:hypothetical protein